MLSWSHYFKLYLSFLQIMRQSFLLTNLTWQEFEDLVILLCQKLYGIAAKTFAVGKDGGKDSYFEGKANCFPSEAKPWEGKFIIQAKHTEKINASCSDSDFSGDGENSILSKEITKLKELKKKEGFDNYIIFTNRKLPSGVNTTINNRLRKELQIENTYLVGLEEIHKFLSQHPEILKISGLEKYELPFKFYEKDIQKIITIFESQRDNITLKDEENIFDFDNVEKEKKNELNNLSQRYFDIIKNDSMLYFKQIESFLQDNKNKVYTKYYENTVRDLRAKIEVERSNYFEFERWIEYIVDYITDRADNELLECRGLIRVFLHFMYFNCDIGRKK